MEALTERDIERFWSKVDRRGDDECWPWTGRCDPYGAFDLGRHSVRAHRVAFVLGGGALPSIRSNTIGARGVLVLHACDFKPCCNPAHLSAGTQRRNVAEAFERGRKGPIIGERHGMSKLTDAQVAELRQRPWTGRYGEKAEVCRSLGIHKSTLDRVLAGVRKTGGQ